MRLPKYARRDHQLIFVIDEAIDDEAEETPSKKKGRAAKGKGKGKKKTDMDGEIEDDNEDNAVVKGEGEDDGADELS